MREVEIGPIREVEAICLSPLLVAFGGFICGNFQVCAENAAPARNVPFVTCPIVVWPFCFCVAFEAPRIEAKQKEQNYL